MYLKNESKWLFKYMPFNLNAVKLITNNELWFGRPDTHNDPKEAEFILKYNEEVDGIHDFIHDLQENFNLLIEQTDSGKKSPTGFERIEFEKKLKKNVREYLGICSMSSKCDDILMWAHYADNNEGICVVFDREILINSISAKSDKVSYSSSITNSYFWKNGNTGHLVSDRVFYLEKLDNWIKENEFRFIKRFNDRIPQERTERLEQFPENAMIGIIIGENFQKDNFKTLVNVAYLGNLKKELFFWRCSKNLSKQSMDILPITDEKLNIYMSQNDYPFQNILYETKNQLKQRCSK